MVLDSTPPDGPLHPSAPGTRPANSKHRRWNTPQELHQLLFMLGGPKPERQALEIPPLVTKESFVSFQTDVPKPVSAKSPRHQQRVSDGSLTASDKRYESPGLQKQAVPAELRQRGSSLQRTTTATAMARVSSTLSIGQGVALYDEDLRILLPGKKEAQPTQLRVTSDAILFHLIQSPKMRQNKSFTKIPLISIMSACLGRFGTIVLRVERPKSDPTQSAAALTTGKRRLSIPYDTYEVQSSDEDMVDEILLCVLQQQVKAFQSERGKVRRSLRPTGGRVLDIVHFNDVYHLSVFKSEEPCGGITRFYHQLDVLRRTKNPLVLFSGDFVGPSLMSVITKGKQMVDALNFINTHYGVFGNHEFDFGLRNLERIIHGYTQGEYIFAGSNTEWLMTNMDGKDGQPLGDVTRSKLLEWNGIMVGIVGLCENWLPHCPRLAKGEAVYHDMYEVGEREAKSLKARGAEIVLALTHNRLALDKELTDKCPSIDLLLGGHDHSYKKDLDRRIVKSGEEFRWLSEVQIRLDEIQQPTVSCKTHAIETEMPENKMIDKLVQRYGEKMTEKMGKVIGRTNVPLDSTEETCRFSEGVLTNFLADLMQMETGADCAVLGGAAVSGKILKEQGPISIGDVFNWFPDETKVQVVEMSGYWLKEMLNLSVRELPEEAPSFPHPSSQLNYTINSIRSTVQVQDITIGGEVLDLEKEYKIAVTDFVGGGKERFKFIKEHCKVLTDAEHAEQFSMWILDYFRLKKGQRADGADLEGSKTLPVAANGPKRRRRSSFMAPEEEFMNNIAVMGADNFEFEDDFAYAFAAQPHRPQRS